MQPNHDDTSQALLEAAHRLLAEHGSEALTVRRIATEAGMSTMNVYSRFGGKDGVIDELYLYGFNQLFGTIDAVPQTDDVVADLLGVALAYRQFASAYPMYYEIMFRGANPSQQSIDTALAGLGNLVARVEHGAGAGRLRLPEGLDALGTTAWLWGTCHGLVSLELDGVAEEALTWGDIYEAAVRTAVSGLAPSSIPSGTGN
jgi:AcrR family transcriptional regulator